MSSILAHESHLFVTGTAKNGSRGFGSLCRFKSHVGIPTVLYPAPVVDARDDGLNTFVDVLLINKRN